MRETVLLNGPWEFMPIYRRHVSGLPQEICYARQKVQVPSSWRQSMQQFRIDQYGFDPFHMFDYPEEWNGAESGVLHREVELTAEQAGKKLVLHFEGIFQKAYIYWNGTLVVQTSEAYLPTEADITGKGKVGKNDLHVVCTAFDSCVIPSGSEKTTGLAGSWFHKLYRGIWQDVSLHILPKTNIADLEIVTSVRENTLGVIAELDHAAGKSLCLEVFVYDGAEEVKRFSAMTAGAEIVKIKEAWQDPVLWDTEHPHLYRLEARLMENGRVIDRKQERFGFREFWADGQNFMLNGVRINLRGDSWHFQGAVQQTKEYALNWCRVCREYGVNSIRYHANPHPTYYLDAADEMGILVVDETAIYGSGKSMDAAHPDYLDNCRSHIQKLVRRDKNHPSVVMWSLQNEMRWVDGRDEYKKHVPEFMDIFHQADHSGRLVSLDGDNRLIDKAHTEVASLHYNIDGTINQWDRRTPLTIGEHGGLWYICPQNSSMYTGLGVYRDHEACAEGISLKEQLFMEYARRKEVSGISSFNFAHYFATSMPGEDVHIANPPRTIKKNSLTINNGLLPEYPRYIPNAACKYAAEGMRPVTVIPREYDHSFYDDKPLSRTLDVYNDTLQQQDVTLEMEAVQGGKAVWRESRSFFQEPGRYVPVKIRFQPEKCEGRTPLTLTAKLYHGERLMYTMRRTYSIYPAQVKTSPAVNAAISYFGNDRDYEIIRALAPNCRRIERVQDAGQEKILVLSSNLPQGEAELHDALYAYLKNGGRILILEQTGFSFGSMTINKKEFLRAHASAYSHPVFKGLGNDDFQCWLPHAGEYGPDSFINSAFEKPVHGDFDILLECSFGDFNDGGDLWTPLLEYKMGRGAVLACQLEVMRYYDFVPQACVLLRNMLAYLEERIYDYQNTGIIAAKEDKAFLDALGLVYREQFAWDSIGLLIVSPEAAAGREQEIRLFLERGGRLLCLPVGNGAFLSAVTGLPVSVEKRPTYQLWPDYTEPEMRGVSVVDLFGMDKVGMSPREVANRFVAVDTIDAPGIKRLAKSVEDTIWEDLFVDNHGNEYCKRALVAYKKELAEEARCYMAKAGNVIMSQFIVDEADEKSVRVYTRLLANMGARFEDGEMEAVKGAGRYAVESMMALPYHSYDDYGRALAYYSDPAFSLNNLGEGLYGWMKKFERDRKDGFLTLTGSAGQTMFVTCFVHGVSGRDKEYLACLDCNAECTFYLNGEVVNSRSVTLKNGINRIFLLVRAGGQDARLRLVFKNMDGTYATDLLYRTTVDEVDPK